MHLLVYLLVYLFFYYYFFFTCILYFPKNFRTCSNLPEAKKASLHIYKSFMNQHPESTAISSMNSQYKDKNTKNSNTIFV